MSRVYWPGYSPEGKLRRFLDKLVERPGSHSESSRDQLWWAVTRLGWEFWWCSCMWVMHDPVSSPVLVLLQVTPLVKSLVCQVRLMPLSLWSAIFYLLRLDTCSCLPRNCHTTHMATWSSLEERQTVRDIWRFGAGLRHRGHVSYGREESTHSRFNIGRSFGLH